MRDFLTGHFQLSEDFCDLEKSQNLATQQLSCSMDAIYSQNGNSGFSKEAENLPANITSEFKVWRSRNTDILPRIRKRAVSPPVPINARKNEATFKESVFALSKSMDSFHSFFGSYPPADESFNGRFPCFDIDYLCQNPSVGKIRGSNETSQLCHVTESEPRSSLFLPLPCPPNFTTDEILSFPPQTKESDHPKGANLNTEAREASPMSEMKDLMLVSERPTRRRHSEDVVVVGSPVCLSILDRDEAKIGNGGRSAFKRKDSFVWMASDAFEPDEEIEEKQRRHSIAGYISGLNDAVNGHSAAEECFELESIGESSRSSSRSVRFADACGRPLSEIKSFHVLSQFDLENWNIGDSLEDLNGCSDQRANEKTLLPLFFLPSNLSETLRQVMSKKVKLESINVFGTLVLGSVLVANISYHKEVRLRYTYDCWESWSELTLDYVPKMDINCQEQEFDRFSCETNFNCPNLRSMVSFCICFICDKGEFWDNNEGVNYSLKLV